MPLRYVSVGLCEDRPEAYKLCSSGICVDADTKCPCEVNVEYRCWDGDCIPLKHKCDGVKHCHRGEDEYMCSGHMTSLPQTDVDDGVTTPLLPIVVALCLITCALVCILIFVYVVKRRKNNTSRESQSATVPLKKTCIVEVSDVYDKYDKNVQTVVTSVEQETECKQTTSESLANSRTSLDSHEYKVYETWKNSRNKYWGNLGLARRHNEIYALELANATKINTKNKGKYVFKPRLKSLTQDASSNPDDIEFNVALNSYRHFSGKISLPVNFDPEPETFASDLLCASTPRQPVRHLAKDWDAVSCETSGGNVTLNTNLVVKQNTELENEIL